ncbi:2-dehydro-3-deoxygalactonokinase [Shigella flexneri]
MAQVCRRKLCRDAFAAGLERGLNAPADLPAAFGIPPGMCGNTSPRTGEREFLSGLLIGAEVASMRDYALFDTPPPFWPEHR